MADKNESATRSLSVERLVDASRDLLIEGGPPAVVIREVARRLGVTAPALYKHVGGRDALLTLLITRCSEEATSACAGAVEDVAGDDPVGRLRAAGFAFWAWARSNPAEFSLVYGTPIAGYAAPVEGPTTIASRRFGALFGALFVDLARVGRLRKVSAADLPPGLAADLVGYARSTGLPLDVGQTYVLMVGWQRLVGTVLVEVSGHLTWLFDDTGPFVEAQLDALLDDLVGG